MAEVATRDRSKGKGKNPRQSAQQAQDPMEEGLTNEQRKLLMVDDDSRVIMGQRDSV